MSGTPGEYLLPVPADLLPALEATSRVRWRLVAIARRKAAGGRFQVVIVCGLDGSGPIPAWRRSDDKRLREPNPAAVIRHWGALTAEVAPRAAPILLLIRTAAATDPEMAALHQEAEAARLERMEHNARHLHERGYLRQGVSLEHARDVLWSYSSPELYELLVLRRGWPPDRYGRFVADGMIAPTRTSTCRGRQPRARGHQGRMPGSGCKPCRAASPASSERESMPSLLKMWIRLSGR